MRGSELRVDPVLRENPIRLAGAGSGREKPRRPEKANGADGKGNGPG